MTDLPPLDQPQTWIVVRGSEQAGPYTLDLLIDEVVAGRLPDNTPIWWPPMTDWTTMSVHPGVAAEIARRRSAVSTNWIAPQPSPQPAPQPVEALGASQAYDPTAAPTPESPSIFAAPDPATTPDPYGAQAATQTPVDTTGVGETVVDETVADGTIVEPVVDPDSVETVDSDDGDGQDVDVSDAEVVEAAVVESGPEDTSEPEVVAPEVIAPGAFQPESNADTLATGGLNVDSPVVDTTAMPGGRSGLEGSVRADFASLVGRSSSRATRVAAVGAVDESVVSGVVSAAQGCGFTLSERVDVERGHEMKFNDADNVNLLVISLAKITAADPEEIRAAVLPVTISIRSDQPLTAENRPESTGEHGQVVVTPDDWTGKTTSTVSLYLGADDYVGENLVVDGALIQRDIRSAIETVRSALT